MLTLSVVLLVAVPSMPLPRITGPVPDHAHGPGSGSILILDRELSRRVANGEDCAIPDCLDRCNEVVSRKEEPGRRGDHTRHHEHRRGDDGLSGKLLCLASSGVKQQGDVRSAAMDLDDLQSLARMGNAVTLSQINNATVLSGRHGSGHAILI